MNSFTSGQYKKKPVASSTERMKLWDLASPCLRQTLHYRLVNVTEEVACGPIASVHQSKSENSLIDGVAIDFIMKINGPTIKTPEL